MSQYLLLPFDRQMLLCGYKNPQYKAYWGYPHYGIDVSTHQGAASANHMVFASGKGTVTAVGKDNSLGYGICVTYVDCESRNGERANIVARYMHLKSCKVTQGQSVDCNTILGEEGKEGTADFHLHLELDKDTSYPTWTPQVSNGHSFWKKGTDSTVNPSLWLWQNEKRCTVKPTYNPAWLNEEDFNIPTVPNNSLEEENKRLREAITEYEAERNQIINWASQILNLLKGE